MMGGCEYEGVDVMCVLGLKGDELTAGVMNEANKAGLSG